MRKSLDGWKDFNFVTDLGEQGRNVGSTRLPYYPYRDDAQLWWDAIGKFVGDIVDAAYADDAEVTGDKELQKWGGVLAGKRTPVDNGAELIAAPPTTKAELQALLHKIIFTCTAYHAAVQIPLNGFDVSPLTAPGSLYPDDTTAPPESMLATLGTSLFQLAFFYFGDIVTFGVGTHVVEKKDIPLKMQAPVERFAKTLPNIAKRINAANSTVRKAVGAYETLLPDKVSRSVDI
jgi:arachidonate 15-lipoxygenase